MNEQQHPQPDTFTAETADAVIALIQERQHVTFVEIEDLLKRGDLLPTAGDFSMSFTNQPNTLLWMGMSNAWIDLMEWLMRTEKIFPHPAEMLMYLVDGAVPAIPVWQGRATKSPRWLPVCFCTFPLEKSKQSKRR